MSTDKAMYEALIALGQESFPGFRVQFKDESWWSRALDRIMFWAPTDSNYTMTLNRTVNFPSRKWLAEVGYRHAYKVLAHELVHVADATRVGFGRYAVAYGTPQIFGLLALLALLAIPLGPLLLWWLLALGFLAPWPSAGRTDAELRGYAMSMAVNFWRHGSVQDRQKMEIAEKFTGWDYYRMCPDDSEVLRRLDAWAASIEFGEILDDPRNLIFKQVYDLMREQGEIRA